MSQLPITPTSPEALRAAIASAVQTNFHYLQTIICSIAVTTSDESQTSAPEIQSLFDSDSRTLTLLCDRIPAGQEATAFAAALSQHLGHQTAVDLLGDEGIQHSRSTEKVAVACTNANGCADIPVFDVLVSKSEVAEGEHYEMAKELARTAGYEAPFVCFDRSEHSALKTANAIFEASVDRLADSSPRQSVLENLEQKAADNINLAVLRGGDDELKLQGVAVFGFNTTQEFDHFISAEADGPASHATAQTQSKSGEGTQTVQTFLDYADADYGLLVKRSAHFREQSCIPADRPDELGIMVGRSFHEENGQVICYPEIHWEGKVSPSANHPMNVTPFREHNLKAKVFTATPAYEATVEDVENVLRSNSLAVANTNGKSFESMAEELHGTLDLHLIEKAALAGDDLDEQTGYANEEIARQLRAKGVLETVKRADDSPSPGM